MKKCKTVCIFILIMLIALLTSSCSDLSAEQGLYYIGDNAKIIDSFKKNVLAEIRIDECRKIYESKFGDETRAKYQILYTFVTYDTEKCPLGKEGFSYNPETNEKGKTFNNLKFIVNPNFKKNIPGVFYMEISEASASFPQSIQLDFYIIPNGQYSITRFEVPLNGRITYEKTVTEADKRLSIGKNAPWSSHEIITIFMHILCIALIICLLIVHEKQKTKKTDLNSGRFSFYRQKRYTLPRR